MKPGFSPLPVRRLPRDRWFFASLQRFILEGTLRPKGTAQGALVAGGRHALLLPAIGVPAGWRRVPALPWLLLGLSTTAAASVGVRSSAVAGIGPGIGIGLWAYLSLE